MGSRPVGSALLIALAAGRVAAGSSDGGPAPVNYLLREGSTYARGCFPPCECPMMEQGALSGKFRLTEIGFDGLFTYYDLTAIDWTAALSSGDRAIAGDGSYRVGGEFAVEHQLTADLKVGSDPLDPYDSGIVIGGNTFPEIDVEISLHGGFCHDTVLHLVAGPGPTLLASGAELSWEPVAGPAAYDVVLGDLVELGRSGGDYTRAVLACIADDVRGTTVVPATPEPGQGFFFLLRVIDDGVIGSYDSGYRWQIGSRDPEIVATAVCE
jgi:hypothetical protein